MCKNKLLLVSASLFVLSSCSNSSRYINDDDYIYVVDQKRINTVEKSIGASSGNVKAIWINPPVKRVKKSDYLAKQEK